jgi:hypothetical protein
MINPLRQKIVAITQPQAIVNNTSWTTASVDTLGFRYATIIVQLGATDIALTALKIQESDDDGSTDTYADVTGLVASGTSGSGRLPTATDDNSFFAFEVDLKGRNRYLDLVATIGNGSTGGFMSAFALLSRAEESPNTAAERGFAWELHLP